MGLQGLWLGILLVIQNKNLIWSCWQSGWVISIFQNLSFDFMKLSILFFHRRVLYQKSAHLQDRILPDRCIHACSVYWHSDGIHFPMPSSPLLLGSLLSAFSGQAALSYKGLLYPWPPSCCSTHHRKHIFGYQYADITGDWIVESSTSEKQKASVTHAPHLCSTILLKGGNKHKWHCLQLHFQPKLHLAFLQVFRRSPSLYTAIYYSVIQRA